MKKLALAIAVLVALLIAGGWIAWSRIANRLTVTNESGQVVTLLTITIGGKTTRFEDIPAGHSMSARFRIRTDDHFVVRGRLADGAEIAEDCGYVTTGMYGEHAEFLILPGGKVEFRQGQYLTPTDSQTLTIEAACPRLTSSPAFPG